MLNAEQKRAKLRELIERPGSLRSMGIYDAFSAMLLEQAGAPVAFLGGFGASASLLGLPDLDLLTLTEMADHAARIATRLNIPLIVDGDTGHGSTHNIARTVQLFEQAGAAGMLLEDQTSPKRCGHFGGKSVIPTREMRQKLQVALAARRDPNFVIIARTDAREPNGLEDAICRANLYADTGADIVFIEAPRSREELELIPTRVWAPLMANMLVGGKTPILSADELEVLDYKLIVSPIEALAAAGYGVRAAAEAFVKGGRVEGTPMLSFDEVKGLLGFDPTAPDGLRRAD